MIDSLKHNVGYKVAAFAIAVLIWTHVRSAQHPIERRYLEVPLGVVNLPENLQVVERTETVRLAIRGFREEILKVRPSDIRAQIDLAGTTVGRRKLKVTFVVPTWVRAGDVSVDPEVAEVVLDEVVSHTFDVEVRTAGKLPPEYTMSQPDCTPTQATVTGRSGLVREVRIIFAKVHLASRVRDIDEQVSLFPVDRMGVKVAGIVVHPPTARVHIGVSQTEQNKKIRVEPLVSGQPAQGYESEEITVQPASVTISGSPENLRTVQKVATDEIDISGATATTSRQVDLSQPNGLRLTETSARVIVVLRRLPSAPAPRREKMDGGT